MDLPGDKPSNDALPQMAQPQSKVLIERYQTLHALLSTLCSAAPPDQAAIDRTMSEIDGVHAELKALHARAGDAQRY